MRLLLLFSLICHLALSQQTISGTVLDAATNAPVPFASVGIKNKLFGTVCDANGFFELTLGKTETTDTLKISAIGYALQSFGVAEALQFHSRRILLKAQAVQLSEVKVKPSKIVHKTLGVAKFNPRNCTAFGDAELNWKGRESAIRAGNKTGQLVFIEDFNFYIIKNTLRDSLTFRLNLYAVDARGLPGNIILQKPIVFKTAVKQGPVHVDLSKEFIHTSDDFFISIECLEERINHTQFCFSGEITEPSYVKGATFMPWVRVRGGGLALNVTVSYSK